jgi:hypothetical protein
LSLLNETDTILNQFGIQINWSISNTSIVFLDLRVYISNNRIHFEPYSKPLNKYLYIPYVSFHPPPARDAFILTELYRLRRNSSTLPSYIQARDKFLMNLAQRGYPWFYIKKITHRHESTLKDRSISSIQADTQVGTASPVVFITDYNRFARQVNYRKYISPDPETRLECTQEQLRTLAHTVLCFRNGGNTRKKIIRASLQNSESNQRPSARRTVTTTASDSSS